MGKGEVRVSTVEPFFDLVFVLVARARIELATQRFSEAAENAGDWPWL